MKDNFWNQLNTQMMIMAGFRYALGRQSYIVSCVTEWLREHKEHFDKQTIFVIVRDIIEALQNNTAGKFSDIILCWKSLAEDFHKEMSIEDKKLLHDSLEYRNKEWPLSEI